AVPAAVLGLTAHLHALQSRTDPDPPQASPTPDRTQDGTKHRTRPHPGHRSQPGPARPPAGRTPKRPRYRTEDELMTAAREANERHQAAHGRPITRDALRKTLRISGARATELRRQLADEANGHETPKSPGDEQATGHRRSPVRTTQPGTERS
ncbi:MAG TPA: hypothetical protein VFU43_09965, partial [Streptosporangiaceae bacterium]|nr:hypothetical protein [Streptosporangiaceae bacterium]